MSDERALVEEHVGTEERTCRPLLSEVLCTILVAMSVVNLVEADGTGTRLVFGVIGLWLLVTLLLMVRDRWQRLRA